MPDQKVFISGGVSRGQQACWRIIPNRAWNIPQVVAVVILLLRSAAEAGGGKRPWGRSAPAAEKRGQQRGGASGMRGKKKKSLFLSCSGLEANCMEVPEVYTGSVPSSQMVLMPVSSDDYSCRSRVRCQCRSAMQSSTSVLPHPPNSRAKTTSSGGPLVLTSSA